MIYRFTFLLVFAFFAFISFSQPGNLIENPGFEYRPECDDNNGPLSEAPPWFNPTGATPDVFHECAVQLEDPCPYPEIVNLDPWFFGVPTNGLGCQEPKSGAGYAGLYFYYPEIQGVEYREYLAAPLSEPLVSGETYLVRLYMSLAEMSLYAVHAIQVLFTPDAISEPSTQGVLNYAPQLSHTEGAFITDRDNWVELSWEYAADGTEQYMYIGNFQSNAEIDTLYALPDNLDPEDHYSVSYYYVDDVYVGSEVLSVQSHNYFFEVRLWPNPVDQVLTVEIDRTIEKFSLYTVLGSLIQDIPQNRNGRFSLNVSSLASGAYVLIATDQNGYKAAKHFVKR